MSSAEVVGTGGEKKMVPSWGKKPFIFAVSVHLLTCFFQNCAMGGIGSKN